LDFYVNSECPQSLLEAMRDSLRYQQYSFHTERAYCDWVARFIRFHRLGSRGALFVDPARKVEDFLTHLAVHENVAASTQNQAFNALVFLYRRIQEQPFEQDSAVRLQVQAIDYGYKQVTVRNGK